MCYTIKEDTIGDGKEHEMPKMLGQDRLGVEYGCPVEATVDIIGGKWKSVLLFHLLDGEKRFGELRKLLPGVTQRMLTLQFRELEEDWIIFRNVYREVPPKVEYSLTEFGWTLEPILIQMRNWGQAFMRTMAEKQASADKELVGAEK